MPILCFEGPSAVGKTATASALASAEDAYVIPEVKALFERPEREPPEWYVARQVDRYSLAVREVRRHSLVVLDGDPFQPLWYNWAYDFVGWQGLSSAPRPDLMPRKPRPGAPSPPVTAVPTAPPAGRVTRPAPSRGSAQTLFFA